MELFYNVRPLSFIEDLSEPEITEDSVYVKVNHPVFGEVLRHDCQELTIKAFYSLGGKFLSLEAKNYASKGGHTELGLPMLRFIIHSEYLRDGSKLVIARGYISGETELVEKHIMLFVNRKKYLLKCVKQNDNWLKEGLIPLTVIKNWRKNYANLKKTNALLNF